MIRPRTSSCGGAGALWLLLAASISVSTAADPGWWSQPATKIWTSAAAATDHQAPINVGQLKHVASRARIYLDNILIPRGVTDGAGVRIRNMVDGKAGTSETGFTAGGSNASIANVGQLKRVASAFYLRFAEVDPLTAPAIVQDLQKRMGLSTAFQTRPAYSLPEYVLPWLTAPSDEDQAPATVGQLKMLFSFDLAAFPQFPLDSDGDGVVDAREYALHSNPKLADTDGDGLGDSQEAVSQSPENILDFYNGIRPDLTVTGAFSATARIPVAAAKGWVDQPVTVKVTDPSTGLPLINAPLLFAATDGGGGLGHFPRFASETASPVLEARTDASGMVRLSVQTGPSIGTANTFAFWAVTSQQVMGGQFTAWSGASLDFTADSTVFWLKPEQQVTLEEGNRVIKWSDPVSNRSAASAGLARPQFIERNGFPLLNFDGTARLFLDTRVFVSDGGISLFTVTLPEADRAVHPVLNNPARGTIYANNGQRVLLAGGTRSAPDAPFTYTGGTQSTVSDTRYFSCYTQKAFAGSPYQSYSVPDPISSGLDPAVAASSRPQIRYDVTPDAVSTGQQNKKLRSNPNVTNFPLFSGKSESECAAKMKTDLGLSGNLEWTSSSIRPTYTRPGTGTVPVDQSQEVYYKLEGKTSATNGTYTFASGLIGDIAPVISLGSNGLGTYQYHTQFGPCLGSAALPAAPADGSLRLITAQVPYNGGLAAFAQGSPLATSSTTAAGGSDTGYWVIGSYQDGGNSFVGKLGDILIVRGIADATSRQVIEDRLASRYQLAVDRGAVSGGTANSLPDWWERALLGSRYATAASGSTAATPASFATPTADPDGDTLTNAQEWALGTNPALADSDGDGLSDKIETASDSLTKATNPDTDKDGFPDGADAQPTNPANGLADTSPKNGRPDGLDYLLSRPVADNVNPDTDLDGLSDLFELTVTHTNITSEDSDGDYLSDKWEYENSLNPLTAIGDNGSEGDKDGDGLSNFSEWTNGSNPNRKDSDGDGVNDATEVAGHSNPADASDKGQPVPADQIKTVNFHFYGDFAAWEITIQGTGKDTYKWQYRTDTPGQIKDVPVDLKPGNPYEIRLKWLKSRQDEGKNWYCWEAQVDSLPNTQTFGNYVPTRVTGAAEFFAVGGHWLADNRSGLLTAHVHMKTGEGGNVAGSLVTTLSPIEIVAHKRGTLNVPGLEVPRNTGEFGYETVMMENGNSQSAVDSNGRDCDQAGNLSVYRQANDDDLVKVVLKFPAKVKAEGASLKLFHEGIQVDATKKTSEEAVSTSGPSRLKFYKSDGTLMNPDTDLQITDLANPPAGRYLSKIVTDGEVTLFIEGGDKFGDLPTSKMTRLGGARLTLEFQKGGTKVESELLVYRGGFLRFLQPAGAPGTIGKLQLWDGKGRIRHEWGGYGNEFKKDETDMGTLLGEWEAKSGKTTDNPVPKYRGHNYNISDKYGHTPPGWWREAPAGALTGSQPDQPAGIGNKKTIKQGNYRRWKQDDETDPSKRYTIPYRYDASKEHDRAIGEPTGIGFKYNLVPITEKDPQPTLTGVEFEVKEIPEAQNRNAIQIHPDGECNNSVMGGTAGCIGIQTYNGCVQLKSVLEKYRSIKVKVEIK